MTWSHKCNYCQIEPYLSWFCWNMLFDVTMVTICTHVWMRWQGQGHPYWLSMPVTSSIPIEFLYTSITLYARQCVVIAEVEPCNTTLYTRREPPSIPGDNLDYNWHWPVNHCSRVRWWMTLRSEVPIGSMHDWDYTTIGRSMIGG